MWWRKTSQRAFAEDDLESLVTEGKWSALCFLQRIDSLQAPT